MIEVRISSLFMGKSLPKNKQIESPSSESDTRLMEGRKNGGSIDQTALRLKLKSSHHVWLILKAIHSAQLKCPFPIIKRASKPTLQGNSSKLTNVIL